MIRRLITLFRSPRPVVATSLWLSLLLVGFMAAVAPTTSFFTPSAYAFNGDGGTSRGQGGGGLFTPLGSLLRMILVDDGTGTDDRGADRAGKRVALQAGHWRYQESPPPLNTQTGTSGGGKTEPEVTLDIAQRTAKILEDLGYTVEILPAWFARGYTADAVVAIHADGAANPDARGFFADSYADSAIPEVDAKFMATIDEEYAKATDLPFKYRSTPGSRYYYGYSLIQPKTPTALIETGFLTNEQDREIIVGDPGKAAWGIAMGIDKFLLSRAD